MSPEQAQGDVVDARTDLYGLGATLYNAITGEPPFAGNDAVAVLMGHMAAPIPDPRDVRPEISEDMAMLVMSMLAKTPEERPTSALEILGALEAFSV